MVLVDTSVWIDYLRSEEPHLVYLLNENQVLVHPFVIGELALGNLRNREEPLSLLGGLPVTPVATGEEVLFFVERHRLMEHGICYVDAHLLAAATLAGHLPSMDRRSTALGRSCRIESRLSTTRNAIGNPPGEAEIQEVGDTRLPYSCGNPANRKPPRPQGFSIL